MNDEEQVYLLDSQFRLVTTNAGLTSWDLSAAEAAVAADPLLTIIEKWDEEGDGGVREPVKEPEPEIPGGAERELVDA